jgi:hypothetical protein
MSNPHPKFVDFIKAAVAALELPGPEVAEDRYMFKVGARWVELKFSSKDQRVTFASLVHVRKPDMALRADLIADFNYYHLFNGGYALVAIDGAILYLCRPCRLGDLDPGKIRGMLEDFMRRSDAAAIWRLTKSEETDTAFSPPPGPIRDPETVMRL